MDLDDLQSLLARVADVPVAVVGDIMIDRFVYGEVARISPEAPIPVLNATREETMLGGAGNVARNIVSLGGRARLVGRVGPDAGGDALRSLAEAVDGLQADLICDPQSRTTLKTRFVAGTQQLLRLDAEDCRPSAGSSARALTQRATGALDGCRVLLVSDYAKGVVSDDLIAACLVAAQRTGAAVIVDPKGVDFARYGEVDLIKPNASELAAATQSSVRTDSETEVALSAALDSCSAKAILVTRAGAGMTLMRRGRPARHFPARPREVFDVSGAGDTALAALGLGLAAGADVDQAVGFAILASGVVVEKAGTATASAQELIDAELAMHAAPAHGKIATAQRMAEEASAWRRQGLRVGFTNGCFDILHRGHVAYLAQARSWCDRLIVALNSDASVRRLKGDGRPVNDLDARAIVLAGLSSVDLVTSFEDDTPFALIAAAKPDVLIKGADYTIDQVVGADLVQSWGGQVKLATFVEGWSTTAAIERMRKA